jgi:signal peptidase II
VRRIQAGAFVSVVTVSIGCDHASKQIATQVLAGAETLSFAGDTLRFELVSNAGAFLSLGATMPVVLRDALLLVGVPLLLTFFCVLLLRERTLHSREIAALGLIVGGGLANWLDRLLHDGAVTDFVSLGIGPLRTGIFNLADVGIVAGVLILLLTRHRGAAQSRNS